MVDVNISLRGEEGDLYYEACEKYRDEIGFFPQYKQLALYLAKKYIRGFEIDTKGIESVKKFLEDEKETTSGKVGKKICAVCGKNKKPSMHSFKLGYICKECEDSKAYFDKLK